MTIPQLPLGNKIKFTLETFVAYEDTISKSIRKISVANLLKQLDEDERQKLGLK